jgi:hypothetical protein
VNLFKRKTIRKGELRNIEVELVSLLFDDMNPANQKGYVVKSAQGRSFLLRASSVKFKSEAVGTQGRLYVTLLEPDVRDSQGDFYNAEEIQKACDHFARHGMVGKCDVNHNLHPISDFFVAENYILKGADTAHFPDTKPGAWVQVLKCDNLRSEFWQKVEKGQFNGVSIYGKAEDVGDTGVQATLNSIKQEIATLRNSSDANMTESLNGLEAKLTELERSSGDVLTREALKGIESGLHDLNRNLTRAISKSIGGEPIPQVIDRELVIDGQKVLVKSSHREIYKGIADVDSGQAMGILTANNTSLFIDEVIGSKPGDTLSDITVVPLLKDEKIDVGLIDDLIFKNSLDGTLTAQEVATADIACATGILNAEFRLGRDIVEFYKDKYGAEAFGAYVEQNIARKTEKAMRLLLFQGDRASATPKLKALDGIVKQATAASAVTNLSKATYTTWADRFEALLLAFSDDMLEEQTNFNIYVAQRDLIKIRDELAKRQTNAGDRLLLEGGNVSFAGIPVKGRLLPSETLVAGLPKFIILGYRTEAEMKVEHHGDDWKYHWYIRIRPGITYVNGFVKVFKLTT